VKPEQDEGARIVADVVQFGKFAADFEISNRRRCPHSRNYCSRIRIGARGVPLDTLTLAETRDARRGAARPRERADPRLRFAIRCSVGRPELQTEDGQGLAAVELVSAFDLSARTPESTRPSIPASPSAPHGRALSGILRSCPTANREFLRRRAAGSQHENISVVVGDAFDRP
jgi:hypothetical protein